VPPHGHPLLHPGTVTATILLDNFHYYYTTSLLSLLLYY
jgi:hypothetical protein